MRLTKKEKFYVLLTVMYCCMLIVTNIISNRTFEIGSVMLPSAVIAFPIIYIINDIMTECFGIQNAKVTITMAFVMNFIAVVCFNIAIHLPTTQDFSAYNIVLGNTPKALIASLIAYLVGSFINAEIMDRMKKMSEEKLMLRCVLSTLFGEGCDALIFISIMFIGVLPINVVMQMIVTQALVKTAYEIVVYPITKKVVRRINAM